MPMYSSRKKGSLIIEAMIAITVLTIFLVSALTLAWTARTLYPKMSSWSSEINSWRKIIDAFGTSGYAVQQDVSTTSLTLGWFDDGGLIVAQPSSSTHRGERTLFRTGGGFGASSCSPRFGENLFRHPVLTYISDVFEQDNIVSGLIARGKYVYVSADSPRGPAPDFFIFDTSQPSWKIPVSSGNTGPGIRAIVNAGAYIYAANTSSTNQLQVIDISNLSTPIVVSKFRLPQPAGTSSALIATSIAYSQGRVYIGTEKSSGPEVFVVDVTIPSSPHLVASIEIDSTVEDLHARDNRLFVASAGVAELSLFDIADANNIQQLQILSPNGWQIEEGNRITFHHGAILYGRVGGGFNTSQYKELFMIDPESLSPTKSVHISGGVYGVIGQYPYVFVATGENGGEFAMWDSELAQKTVSILLGSRPTSMTCSGEDMYVGVSDTRGFVRINI